MNESRIEKDKQKIQYHSLIPVTERKHWFLIEIKDKKILVWDSYVDYLEKDSKIVKNL